MELKSFMQYKIKSVFQWRFYRIYLYVSPWVVVELQCHNRLKIVNYIVVSTEKLLKKIFHFCEEKAREKLSSQGKERMHRAEDDKKHFLPAFLCSPQVFKWHNFIFCQLFATWKSLLVLPFFLAASFLSQQGVKTIYFSTTRVNFLI